MTNELGSGPKIFCRFPDVGVITNSYNCSRCRCYSDECLWHHLQQTWQMNLDSDQKYYPTFFTATILEWRSLLANDFFKEIIVESLRYLVKNKKVIVYSFVIMPNHIHLVWQISSPFQYEDVQRDFLKFTAQQIKLELAKIDSSLLQEFYVGAKDREYQFWERKPLSTRLDSMELIEQKVNYIHKNPISGKWHLVEDFLDYRYSSARFYYTEESEFDFLTNYALAYCE